LEGSAQKARFGRHPSFADFAGEGFVFCDKTGKSRSLSRSKGERERDDIFAGIMAVVGIAVILESFCYAGFLRRMRWRGRIF
jgi:hypothetical protein